MSATAPDPTRAPDAIAFGSLGPWHELPSASAFPADSLYRFSVEQYQQLGRAGILTGDDRVEPIEGLVVKKTTKFERRIATTRRIVRAIDRVVQPGWFCSKEDPIVAARSEPEPDVAVLRGDLDDYLDRKPNAADISLVVEVADSSYSHDRRKLAIYAEEGLPTSWIANLNADRIEAYSEPTGPDPAPEYRSRRDYARGDQIPLIIDGREVARFEVDSLLAPAHSR